MGCSFARLGGLGNGGWRKVDHGAQRQTPLRGEGGGVFVWGLPADARMRAVNVILRAPVGQRGAGMGQGRERGRGFVPHLVAQPRDEAFDEGGLRRLARRDVMPVDLAFVGEGEDGGGDELRAVIKADHHGFSPTLDDRSQFPRHPGAAHATFPRGTSGTGTSG